jgi:hypothetical protein
MQTTLRTVNSEDVVAYFVWLPILRSDFRNDALERASEFQDPRVRNYWDENRITGTAWQHRLGSDSVAWDVYFLFDRSTAWQKEVPQPTFWMHQLRGIDKAPFLNEKEFQTRLKAMLEVKK